MKLPSSHDEELVQLATRVPRRMARQLKEFCVRHDIHMQSFVQSALIEKLGRSRGSSRTRAQY